MEKTLVWVFLCLAWDLIAPVLVHGAAGCPSGAWQRHDHSCYLFSNETYTWFDAKIACDALESRLVEIETAAEHQYVKQLIQANGHTQAWIGLEDLEEEGVFRWVSSKQIPELTFWATDEPDDRFNGEDCAAVSTVSGGWFDGRCEATHRNFVCEMPVESGSVIG